MSAEEILRVAGILRSEANRLGDALYLVPGDGFRRCGDDPVSKAAADALNEKSRSLLRSYENHVSELRWQADTLSSATNAYRANEANARDGFLY